MIEVITRRAFTRSRRATSSGVSKSDAVAANSATAGSSLMRCSALSSDMVPMEMTPMISPFSRNGA